jgi:hypothetical protein
VGSVATCWLSVDDDPVGVQASSNATLATVPLTGTRTVAAGAHDVAVRCHFSSGGGTAQFSQGTITVMAATA